MSDETVIETNPDAADSAANFSPDPNGDLNEGAEDGPTAASQAIAAMGLTKMSLQELKEKPAAELVAFAENRNQRSERFWRMTNELPFLAAVVIVLAVTTKFGA